MSEESNCPTANFRKVELVVARAVRRSMLLRRSADDGNGDCFDDGNAAARI